MSRFHALDPVYTNKPQWGLRYHDKGTYSVNTTSVRPVAEIQVSDWPFHYCLTLSRWPRACECMVCARFISDFQPSLIHTNFVQCKGTLMEKIACLMTCIRGCLAGFFSFTGSGSKLYRFSKSLVGRSSVCVCWLAGRLGWVRTTLQYLPLGSG